MAENKILADPTAEDSPRPAQRIALSNTLLVALSLVLVCAVAWAFFMGLMVGRGQNPKTDIPAITGLVPDETPAPAPAPQDTSQIAANDAVHAAPSGEAAKAWPAAVMPPAKPVAPTKPAPKPVRRPLEPKADPTQKYKYTFQVAALKNQADATTLQKTLREKGVRATLKKSGRVHLLLVSLTGTQTDVRQFETKLKSVRLGKPLQLERTPVSQPVRKK